MEVGAELSGAARACAQAEPDHHLAELAGRAGALRQELFGQLQKSPSGVVDNHTGVCVCVWLARSRDGAAQRPPHCSRPPRPARVTSRACVCCSGRHGGASYGSYSGLIGGAKYRILPVLIFRLCAVMYGSHIVNLLLLSARIT